MGAAASRTGPRTLCRSCLVGGCGLRECVLQRCGLWVQLPVGLVHEHCAEVAWWGKEGMWVNGVTVDGTCAWGAAASRTGPSDSAEVACLGTEWVGVDRVGVKDCWVWGAHAL